ncbi:MAG: dienelactone hydrolase family protein [Prevotella sp.]|nr:dienelactone hydrolase family protein [Prevotella sp.]
MKKTFILALVGLLVATVAGAQEEKYAFEKERPVFLDSMLAALTYPMAWGHSDIRDFELWRVAARNQLRQEMLMPPPPAADFAPKVLATERRKGYTARKLSVQLTAYSRVTAYELVPDGKGPFPAVLLLHDHGGHFSIGKEKMIRPFGVPDSVMTDAKAWCHRCYGDQFVGDYLASKGYVVFCTDALFWGDRGMKEGSRGDYYRYVAGHFMLMGRNISAWMTFEDQYAAEFMASLPEVDARRLGCMGFSMGAYRAWMLSALTDKVKCGAAVCWMHTTDVQLSPTLGLKRHEEWANLIPGMRRWMDYPHIASIACPKPMLFINGSRDHLFPQPAVEKAFAEMHRVWDSQKVPANLQTEIWDMPHYCGPEVQQRVLKFLDEQLKR